MRVYKILRKFDKTEYIPINFLKGKRNTGRRIKGKTVDTKRRNT